MRLGGRLQAAIEIIDAMDLKKCPASEALKEWGTAHRFAGSTDRAAIGNIVYDVLRRRSSYAWRMESEKTHALVFAAMLDEGSMSIDELKAALENDTFAPAFLSDEQMVAWQNNNFKHDPDYIAVDIPAWTKSELEETFGVLWQQQVQELNKRPPLDLRVNIIKSNANEVCDNLSPVVCDHFKWFPQSLRIAPIDGLRRHPNVQNNQAFQDGLFEIQDLGSQLTAYLAQAKPDEHVLDYCAGAGGKTLALAAEMQNKGQIYAYDAELSRLTPIYERLKRAGIHNAQVHGRKAELEPLKHNMDLVLVDAPCSGTGTWRRHPDAKWRLTPDQIAQRNQDQTLVLNRSSEFVKSGGRLVYITCSLFASENDQQIEKFLIQHNDFYKIDMNAHWQTLLPQAPNPFISKHGLILSPLQTQTDGFFISILKRKG